MMEDEYFLDHQPLLNEMGTPREYEVLSPQYIHAALEKRAWTLMTDGNILPGVYWEKHVAYYITEYPCLDN